jgi:hypothetical protein
MHGSRSTDKDTGYAATETLAGTRLRTRLRDVASSMSVRAQLDPVRHRHRHVFIHAR